MVRITGDVTIAAPVEEVFDLVADGRNEPLYNPRLVRAEKLTDGPVAAGARFAATPRGTGARGTMTVEILEYDRPHRLRNDIRSSSMRVDGTLTFRETGAGTLLRWDWDMRLLGPTRVLTPVLALVGLGWERRNWLDLKRYLEAGAR
ncbi:polyketide cyclase/dehydrase/lipid transport protein [Georgenia soli]|uniref:Polyketide cyclase/dehydrase/lipid transport protein n=1 Tax=Georgenia soli TaxID=638953 RepID=A0A2A9EJB6_9MICO|nr:SRPBCC family protein [Georgenia soli]PFG38998.1 polyketide cyclase/dehydrase/lipid transport protein [Georgenia soli]